jgi:dipeptidase D
MKPEGYPTQPEHLWNHFYNITRVPRPSKKEDKMQEYVIQCAKDAGHEYKVDEVGNVVIYVPASKGFESQPAVIIQNHMDMVTDATPDRKINFDTDPIEVFVKDGWLKADRTTLGADNGIGCAAALAVMTDTTVEHPALELLFTMDEETGLNGAWGVQSNYFKADKMINLDTEEWGSLYTGCAGGIDYQFEGEFKTRPSNLNTYQLKISGLVGGHSGVDIHLQHANAIKLAADAIFGSNLEYEVAAIVAGRAHNIIPRDAQFFINIDESKKANWEEHLKAMETKWKSYFVEKDLNFKVELSKIDDQPALTPEDSQRLLSFITLFPHGAHAYLETDRNLVAISNNLAITRFIEGKLFVQTSLRFFDRNEIVKIEQQMIALAKTFNLSVEKHGEYPSWKPAKNNKLLDLVKDTYKENFNEEAHVTAIHAGLECGILRDRIGEIDAVSFGPTIMGAHSPDERLEIKTVEPFWDLLVNVLKKC